jgi:hypothetical protein
MPEQITKYPDVTLKVLEGAGAVCGRGAPQKILTKCPAERFCALPTGEICVYGIADIPRMTQITPKDLAPVVCPRADQGQPGLATHAGVDALLLAAALLIGLSLNHATRTLFRRRSAVVRGSRQDVTDP